VPVKQSIITAAIVFVQGGRRFAVAVTLAVGKQGAALAEG